MPGVRVYQLAKELKVQSALILELLDRLGKDVHSDLSSIDDPTAHLVRERLTTALANEKKRLLEQQRAEDGSGAGASSVVTETAVATAEPVEAAVSERASDETSVEAALPAPDTTPVPSVADHAAVEAPRSVEPLPPPAPAAPVSAAPAA